MFKLVLKRISENEHGTFGVFINDNSPLCLTLERQWADNKKDISCIPPGTYQCIKHHSEKFPDTWEVCNVPGRTAILIHCANSIDDLHGCIGVGCTYMPYGLSLSRVAMENLRSQLPSTFPLTVIGV